VTAVPNKRRSSRLLNALAAIIPELFPELELTGAFGYEVTSQSGAFVTVRPVQKDRGLPETARVRFMGAPGVAGQLEPGTRVALSFVDGDRAQPFIAAVEGADGGGFLPISLRVDASSHVDVGHSAAAVNLAEAFARILRDGEAIAVSITGTVVPGGGTSGSVVGTGTISIDYSKELVPGPPGVNPGSGYSKALA
jgi:hypothetical protein